MSPATDWREEDRQEHQAADGPAPSSGEAEGMDGKRGKVSAHPWTVLAPRQDNFTVGAKWGKVGGGKFIDGCGKLSCLSLILPFSLLCNSHLV